LDPVLGGYESLDLEQFVAHARRNGLEEYGFSNHLHTKYNLPFLENAKAAYEKIMAARPELEGEFFFGIEVSCVTQWEIDKISSGDFEGDPIYGIGGRPAEDLPLALDIDQDFLDEMGIAYVVGGAHWTMNSAAVSFGARLEDYHRQVMFLARHEFVDILAHWLWIWSDRDGQYYPFFTDFSAIPE
jgi:hypothetical protein